jgi:hypothetical protein
MSTLPLCIHIIVGNLFFILCRKVYLWSRSRQQGLMLWSQLPAISPNFRRKFWRFTIKTIYICMIQIFQKLVVSWTNKALFRKIFGENIFKIITSIPGGSYYCLEAFFLRMENECLWVNLYCLYLSTLVQEIIFGWSRCLMKGLFKCDGSDIVKARHFFHLASQREKKIIL